jgi:hypothetical protein
MASRLRVGLRWLLIAAVVGIVGVANAQAAPAMRIVMLVDNSSATSAALPQMRTALAAFLDAVPAGTEVALASTGRRPQVRVPPTTDLAKLKNSVGGLLTENGPSSLIDALQETEQRFLRKPGDHRPVFIIVTGTGSDNSQDNDDKAFNRWLTETAARGVSANAVILKTVGNSLTEIVATTMVKATGGHSAAMSSGAGMSEALTQLLAQLAADVSKRP